MSHGSNTSARQKSLEAVSAQRNEPQEQYVHATKITGSRYAKPSICHNIFQYHQHCCPPRRHQPEHSPPKPSLTAPVTRKNQQLPTTKQPKTKRCPTARQPIAILPNTGKHYGNARAVWPSLHPPWWASQRLGRPAFYAIGLSGSSFIQTCSVWRFPWERQWNPRSTHPHAQIP